MAVFIFYVAIALWVFSPMWRWFWLPDHWPCWCIPLWSWDGIGGPAADCLRRCNR